MAIVEVPYSSDNWVIETYVPEPGAFILDFSQLDDTSTPLGSTGGSLEPADVRITSIQMSEGGFPDFGVYTPLLPPTLSAGVEILNFTVADINKFYTGSEITVGYYDTLNSISYAIFTGKIVSSNVTVIPGSTIAQVSIEATSLVTDHLNTQIPITKVLGANVFDAIQTAAAAYGISVFSAGSDLAQFGGAGREVKTLGEWLNDPAVTELQIPFYNAGAGLVYYLGNSEGQNPTEYFDSSAIIDAQFDWSGAGSPTGVTLTGISDTALLYQYGTDGANSNGQTTNFTASVEMDSVTEMATLGQQLLSMTKRFQPVMITTVTANAQRKINWNDGLFELGNIAKLTDFIQVQLDEFDYQGDSWVVGRTINVTPDDWTTTYNLWKGFTN